MCSASFHGQLFRNIVFAQAMARDAGITNAEWAVVNLVMICNRLRLVTDGLAERVGWIQAMKIQLRLSIRGSE